MFEKFFKSNSSNPNVLVLAAQNYFKIGGAQWAAAFAYYAFFSMFPLVVLVVTATSFFGDRVRGVQEAIGYFKNYAPLDVQMKQDVFDAITKVVEARGIVAVIAPLIFFWGAFRFFNVLIRAVNQAWGTQAKSGWHLPFRNFFMLGFTGGTILMGLAVPTIVRLAKSWLFSTINFAPWMYGAVLYTIPLIVLFLGLSLLYRQAPWRPTRFAEVWLAALAVAALLCGLESLFAIYLKNFPKFNVVYGTFGGMMALLTWIYVSGCFIVLGACLSAAQAQMRANWWNKSPSKRGPG
jgi:YihY family inner membrane protein